MTPTRKLGAVLVACVVLGAITSRPFAFCRGLGESYAVFQCGYLAYFGPAPAPFGPADVIPVFWQIGFGNDLENPGDLIGDGTGVRGPGVFGGNDSGIFAIDLRDASAEFPGYSFPPGSMCLGSNNWANAGVDGCPDNPRSASFYYGGYPYTGDDDLLNPYFGILRYTGGYPGYYSLAAVTDYPMAVLLKTPDERFFAVAAVKSFDRGNDGTGDNGPCAPVPGSNPGPCQFQQGWYSFADVSNGLPNANDPAATNVVPWQATPEPAIHGNTPVDPNDPNSGFNVDLSWPAAVLHSDQSSRPSTNPTLAPADANASPGVGVLDIEGRFGLIHYALDIAHFSDPGFSSPVSTTVCPGDPGCTAPTSASLFVPSDHCVRLRTAFGVRPRTTSITKSSCRLGKCGDIGYDVASGRICFLGECSPTTEICDQIDNDCDGSVDEDFGVGDACDGTGECGAGLVECTPAGGAICSSDPGGSIDQSSPETCDNLDNDCDGLTDGFQTICGLAECTATGTCTAGTDTCVPAPPSQEICDSLDNDCDGVVDNISCGTGACLRIGSCSGGSPVCTPGAPSPEVCDGIDNDCDGQTDENALTLQANVSITPTTLNVNSQGTTFSLSLSVTDACDPNNPVPVDGALYEDLYISRVTTNPLPKPHTVPCPDPGGSFLFERGIVDNILARVVNNNGATLKFNVGADGDCRTLEGDRQDLIALLSDVPDNTMAAVCVAGRVLGVPFEACTTVVIRNRGNR
jgi:hypothetical protein